LKTYFLLDDLYNHFSKFGTLVDYTIILDANNSPQGCGFVQFLIEESVAKALAQSHVIGHSRLSVRRAVPEDAIPRTDDDEEKEENNDTSEFHPQSYSRSQNKKIWIAGMNPLTDEGYFFRFLFLSYFLRRCGEIFFKVWECA